MSHSCDRGLAAFLFSGGIALAIACRTIRILQITFRYRPRAGPRGFYQSFRSWVRHNIRPHNIGFTSIQLVSATTQTPSLYDGFDSSINHGKGLP
jgi:hypothetical protein